MNLKVTAHARLHFGFLDLSEEAGGRRFGGLGMSLTAPRLVLRLESAPGLSVEGRPWHLVEAAAHAAAVFLLERFPQVGRTVVRVRKYVLPETSHVEVQMERRR